MLSNMDFLSKLVVSAIAKIAAKSVIFDIPPFKGEQVRADGFNIFVPQGKTETGKTRKAYWRKDPRNRQQESRSAFNLGRTFSVKTNYSSPVDNPSVYKNQVKSILGDIGKVLNLSGDIVKASEKTATSNTISVRDLPSDGYYVPPMVKDKTKGDRGEIALSSQVQMNSEKERKTNHAKPYIRKLAETDSRSLILYHEFGHKIDTELLGNTRYGVPGSDPSVKKLDKWRDAVSSSKAYKELKTFDGITEQFREYYLYPHELFARSFEQ